VVIVVADTTAVVASTRERGDRTLNAWDNADAACAEIALASLLVTDPAPPPVALFALTRLTRLRYAELSRLRFAPFTLTCWLTTLTALATESTRALIPASITDWTLLCWLRALAAWALVAASPAETSLLVTDPDPPAAELTLTRFTRDRYAELRRLICEDAALIALLRTLSAEIRLLISFDTAWERRLTACDRALCA
jgi:hypothetical protein